MMLRHLCASALAVALVTAHPAAKHVDRACVDDCIVAQETPAVEPSHILQAVVWVNKLGEPVCTITETILVEPTPPPPPPPPAPKIKVVVDEQKEGTTITTLTTASTTTILVKPIPATHAPAPPAEAPPAKAPALAVKLAVPHPAPEEPAPEPLAVGEANGCVGDCTVPVDEGAECEGDCPQPLPHPVPKPQPAPKPVHTSPKPVPVPEVVEGSRGGHKTGGSSSVDIGSQHGVSYAAYRADHSCKSKEDIDDDFDQMKGQYSVVRTYGVDCDQVGIIYKAAKRIGTKVLYGIWDLSAVQEEAQKIIAGVHGDWDIVHSVSVGNELVNNGEATAQQVIEAVKSARSILRSAGYQGPVVAVDTFIATEANPELCEQSDYCAINAHAFFDSTISADQAGPWLEKTIKSIQSKLSSEKQIIITETGWPTEGSSNGLAIPSIQNQKLAIESISKSFADSPGNVILFSAFNDLWKGERDKFWGIGGAVSRCDR